MNLKELIENFNKVKEELRKQVQENLQSFLLEELSPYFKNRDVVGIRWTQYTPGFNDGDPCTFNLHGVYVQFKDTKEDAGDYEDGFIDSYSAESEDQKKTIKDIDTFIASVPEEFFQQVFGDGRQITVTESGLENDDYDCGY